MYPQNTLELLNLFFNATNFSIFIIDKSGKVCHSFKLSAAPDLPEEVAKKIINRQFSQGIHMLYLSRSEKLLIFPVLCKDETTYLVLWPAGSLTNPSEFYQEHLPPISTVRLISYGKLLYYLLFEQLPKRIDPKLDDSSSAFFDASISIEEPLTNREEGFYHKSFLAEQQLFNAVEKGDLSVLQKQWALFMKSGSFGRLANEELRDKKDLIIATITLATRSAIRGGMLEGSAYNLSDRLIQHIEAQKSLEHFSLVVEEILKLFAAQVHQSKARNETRDIRRCQNYIYNHLYQKLTLKELAKEVSLNPSYLSDKFKKETGLTIMQYAMVLKIEEAKQLLVFSDCSITDIYMLLGFKDQSHFTKLFKKQVGVTPLQYRKHYLL